MQERFKQLLEEKNLTATRFAAMIKVNASAMSHILNGRSKPGFDVNCTSFSGRKLKLVDFR